ncbi:MAG: type II toxin-antitoxin system VapC family toxin, partial [Thermodesulfobacteriota bacterium]
ADNGPAETLDNALEEASVVTGDLILMEVLQGFKDEKSYKTAFERIDALEVFEMLGREMALKCAGNFRFLRGKGVTIRKTADVIIATFCIENKMPLLFSDKDFKPFVKHLGLIEASGRHLKRVN